MDEARNPERSGDVNWDVATPDGEAFFRGFAWHIHHVHIVPSFEPFWKRLVHAEAVYLLGTHLDSLDRIWYIILKQGD